MQFVLFIPGTSGVLEGPRTILEAGAMRLPVQPVARSAAVRQNVTVVVDAGVEFGVELLQRRRCVSHQPRVRTDTRLALGPRFAPLSFFIASNLQSKTCHTFE